jgi:NADH-quinone oxidoreductase subunit L
MASSFDILPWLLLFFPLLGVVINGFLGPRLGRRWVSRVGPGVVLLSFLTTLIPVLGLIQMPGTFESHSRLFTWIAAGSFKVEASLLLDPLSPALAFSSMSIPRVTWLRTRALPAFSRCSICLSSPC